ncbi:hypothetical protein [Bacillus sp. B1-b2]|uniref:hypothetical protein n=1 Tax=Bacillus sp. B1-b2 TaxID=2653201 RepID=UPI0012621A4B|nr:hypothetical protein [Bacillus sp. B1-b2]KAB7668949.1 hypothetical protein F9279_12145 [Bacillus sp. B1-b2]
MKEIKVKDSKDFILEYIYGVHGQKIVITEEGGCYRVGCNTVSGEDEYEFPLNQFNEFSPFQLYKHLEENDFSLTLYDENEGDVLIQTERIGFRNLFDSDEEILKYIKWDLVDHVDEHTYIEEDDEEEYQDFKDDLLDASTKEEIQKLLNHYIELNRKYDIEDKIDDFMFLL